jgi:hypothetical protein
MSESASEMSAVICWRRDRNIKVKVRKARLASIRGKARGVGRCSCRSHRSLNWSQAPGTLTPSLSCLTVPPEPRRSCSDVEAPHRRPLPQARPIQSCTGLASNTAVELLPEPVLFSDNLTSQQWHLPELSSAPPAPSPPEMPYLMCTAAASLLLLQRRARALDRSRVSGCWT